MALKNNRADNNFITILADGTMRVSVPEFTEGAVTREYETSDGKTGTKHEMVYTELSGMITKVAFFDGAYGKLLQLTVEDEGEDPIILSVGTETNFGEDLMKKLPKIDMTLPVRIAPYSLTTEKGKLKKGVSVYQTPDVINGEIKLSNYFYDEETKKNLYGYPDIPAGHGKKPVSKEQWKMYFMEARIFLMEFITKKFNLDDEQPSDEVTGKGMDQKDF